METDPQFTRTFLTEKLISFLILGTLVLSVHSSVYARDQGVKISEFDLENPEKIIYITDQWKFQPGDNPDWKEAGFDDAEWETVSTFLTEDDITLFGWEGYGWFRLEISVDSSLVNQPLAFLTDTHFGASDIYMDGELLFSIGRFSVYEDQTVPFVNRVPKAIVFPDTAVHQLAVRYANFNAEPFLTTSGTAGFRILLGDLDYHLNQRLDDPVVSYFWQTFFFGGLLAFTLIHILLFIFYPAEKRNLYFSMFTGLLALIACSAVLAATTTTPLYLIFIYRITEVIWILTIIYALCFTYSLYYDQTPVQFYLFLGAGVLLIILGWYSLLSGVLVRELFVSVTVFEMFRILFRVFREREPGAWIIGTGLLCFLVAIICGVLVNLGITDGNVASIHYSGSGILIISMSLFLSRSIAVTQKQLEYKLEEIRDLSRHSLEQERVNKQKEIEKKLLEAENDRKSLELEEARALQLTMLPKKLPDVPEWDIAVFMETATEVGGDYYDYSLSRDGTMTVVLGDATGHGMKAGIMVATAKSYFHTLAGVHDNLSILKRMSSGFRNLDLKKLFMGITLLRCENHTVTLTSAGMPPSLLYRKCANRVDRITLRGLPLGTKVDYPYESRKIAVEEGDVILLMSDGLMELFNDKRAMLGMERIESTLLEASRDSAADIINRIISLIEKWAGQSANEDDITLMVLKAKQN